MENKKNDKSYNNENYLDKRVNTDNSKNAGALDKTENKTEKKVADFSKENSEIKPIENISDSKPENQQKEMHPEIRKKKNKDLTIPLILGVVIIMVIGIVAVYFLMNKESEQEEANHQQIIKSSMEAMQKVKTYSYDGIIELNIENGEDSEDFNFNIELSGKDDITDINNIKSSANLKLIADVDMEGGNQELSFDLDVMQFGQKKTYFKINDFDLGMFGMMLGPEVNSFKGAWYKFDLEELEKLSAASSSGEVGNMNMMATYDMNNIMALYNKYELLKFQEDLGDVKLGDIDTYHYKVKLDGVALANFYMDVMKEMIAEMDPADKGEILTEGFGEAFKEIQDSIEKYDYVINKVADNVDVEIWIGKDDKLIYGTKIIGMFDEKFVKMIEDEMIARGDIEEKNTIRDEDGLFEFYADIKISDFNQPVEINEPEEAGNLVEVLTGMFGGFMGTGITETDTDADGLPDYLEDFYGTDPNNPDTDGDGYTDGEEVESGYDPLIPGEARLDYDKLFKM